MKQLTSVTQHIFSNTIDARFTYTCIHSVLLPSVPGHAMALETRDLLNEVGGHAHDNGLVVVLTRNHPSDTSEVFG